MIYNFKCKGSCNDAAPSALTVLKGMLYGTTTYGPANQDPGTVFSVTTAGKVQVLHKFDSGSDGAYPQGGLTVLHGTLYGTTFGGGGSGCNPSGGCGTMFKVTTSGAESVLYSFIGGAYGATPYAGLIAVKNVLYGTTEYGGASNNGTVFGISP